MAALVGIVSRHGLTIEMRRKTNQIRLSWHCISHYFHLRVN